MTDDPTALQALRARHRPVTDVDGSTWCVHDDMPWPCDATVLLAEVERLRAAMERAFRDAVDTPADAEAILGYALYGAEWESR